MNQLRLATTIICSVLFFSSIGCVNGPARYKLLGFQKYATNEIPQSIDKSEYCCLNVVKKGTAGICGVPIDAGVMIFDMVLTPIVATNLSGPHPAVNSDDPRLRFVYIPFYAIGYTIYDIFRTKFNYDYYGLLTLSTEILLYPAYVVMLQFADREEYETYFGESSGVFM